MNAKNYFLIIVSILIISDITIILDIPFLRQIFGFLFLTILPGLLILQILKLSKIGYTEKFVLAVGLSISFLMFFGLLINNSSLYFGYESPLLTVSLLVSFNVAFIILAFIGYMANKDTVFSLPNLDLSTSEKAFLTIPILFPALSIFGMHIMNTTNNNIVLMLLLFLIPIYVAFVCFFNHNFSKRLYPVVIFSISMSLLLIFMLRFPHICGCDVHAEYYLFTTTLDNLHWGIIGYSTFDACLSISLLPAIYQSILNINAQEYLFKGVYVVVCSLGPLAIYATSKKYVGELYAFLASFFFMSQSTFLVTAGSPRTSLAIFFVVLAIMVLFNDNIDPLKRSILFIVFIISCIVSHYSTSYLFFFTLLFSWFAVEVFSKRYTFKKSTSLTIVLLFFAFVFFWYSQVTEVPFNSGVTFVEKTIINLKNFFIEESRAETFEKLGGQKLAYPILSKINLAFTWATFILISIGVVTLIKRYKEMIAISNIKHQRPHFLKTEFEMEYLAMVLACAGLLVIMVALPYVSVGYGIQRLYQFVIIILSVFFVIGGITLSKHFFFFYKKRKPVLKEKNNGSQVRACLVILLIVIPYFLFATGAMYQLFGVSSSATLKPGVDMPEYVHDSESCAAKWLVLHEEKKSTVYTGGRSGTLRLISQGKISPGRIEGYAFSKHCKKIKGYIYLSYNNVVNSKLVVEGITYNLSEYSDMFIGKDKIYDSRGAEIYR